MTLADMPDFIACAELRIAHALQRHVQAERLAQENEDALAHQSKVTCLSQFPCS
jgi:hypothetical protein